MKQNNFKEALHNQFKVGYHKGYSKGHTDGVHFTIENYSAIVLICLKDKFDFTPEQLQEITAAINDQFDSVDRGYVTFEDILHTIDEETGLHVTYHGGVDLAKEGEPSDQ